MTNKRVRNFDAWLEGYLKERKNLSPQQVSRIKRISVEEKVPFHDIVIQEGIVSLEEAFKMANSVLAHKVSRVPEGYDLEEGEKLLSKRLIEKHNLIPIEINKEDNTIMLLTSNPTNLIALDEVRRDTRLNPKPIFTLHPEIRKTLDKNISTLSTIIKEMDNAKLNLVDSEREGNVSDEGDDTIVVRLVDSLLSEAMESNASDIHIEPLEDSIRVRFRIDGILVPKVNSLDRGLLPAIISRIKVLGSMDISETRRPQDGRFRIKTTEGNQVDFRASTMFTQHGEKAVLRMTQQDSNKTNIDSIDLTKEDKEVIKRITKSPYGLLLVTGPTGSGKTTTLYGILDYLNTSEKNIVTIEEPIERELQGINQTPVNPKANITFSNGLKMMLRQDPDVLMVGEIRDSETAETTIQAALTGHLVLSTLHTNDSAGAIVRLQDMGVAPYKIPSSLLGVIAQRLIRVNCEYCTKEYSPSTEELAIIKSIIPDVKNDFHLKKGEGCEHCNHTGFKGRKAIFEILTLEDESKQLILEGKNSTDIKQIAINNGMKTIEYRGVEEVIKGTTTVEELQRVIFFK